MSLAALVESKRIVLCVGAGGVGKTTCSAALGLGAALRGRRTLVLTIDPARRLAAAMGLHAIDHLARRVEPERFRAAGLPPAPLHVMTLDVRRTFDELIARFAKDPAARERFAQNRIYREITERLAGSHEYAAMEKLRALDEERQFDLIVLDTPPSRNALDFLDAPEKVAEAIDSPAVHWLMRAGSLGARGLGLAGTFVLRRLARFVGSSFLEDIGGFLGEFNALFGGFRKRAEEVQALFHDPDLAFVIAASPDRDAVNEALFFAERLRSSRLGVGGFVVNRVCPAAPEPPPDDLAARLGPRGGLSPAEREAAAASLRAAWRDMEAIARGDAVEVARLEARGDGAPLARIPLFEEDVHDLGGLAAIADHLVGPT